MNNAIHRTAIATRTAAPIVAGALLLIGCGAAGESASPTDAGELDSFVDDAGLECETDADGGVLCIDPNVVPIDPSAPPVEPTPAAIPDGVYRGRIDRTPYIAMVTPEVIDVYDAGESELRIEVAAGEIVAFSASASFSHPPVEADGYTVCGVDQTDVFTADLSGAWIDGTELLVPTETESSGTLDCGDGPEPVGDAWSDFDVIGSYADGRIEVEFENGFPTFTAELVAD